MTEIDQALTPIEAIDPDLTAWPDPRPLKSDLPPPPPFRGDLLLPDQLREFVFDEADRMPCPPDFVAAALIVALGAVIGARCSIKPKRRDDWIVTPNLFGGVVGPPSTLKTPAINAVFRFLNRLEAREAERLQDRTAAYQVERAAYEVTQAVIQTQMKKAAKEGKRSPAMSQAMRQLAALEKPQEPKTRRYLTSDATVPKIGDILVDNPAGLLVFRDELVGLLASWEREGAQGDRAFYLEGWNGTSSYSIDRIGRGSLFIPNLCLSVFGGIPPDLMERYLAGIANSLDNDGRAQRFQVVVFPDPAAWKWVDRHPAKGAREAVREVFDRLADFDPLQDGAEPADDFVKLPFFSFDDQAQELFVQWMTDLQTELVAREMNPLMQQHLQKYPKLFASIALILHLASGQIGPVKADAATRAAAWCSYLEGHARRVFALAETAAVTAAQLLARKLRERKLTNGFTARDVVRKGWSTLLDMASVERALTVLVDFGWVVSLEGDDGPGRPTTRHFINPKIPR